MTHPAVLLIDDDPILIEMYTTKFRLDGRIRLLTALTPGQGIEMASTEHPGLILLDLVMPKSDKRFGRLNEEVGFHVLETLKAHPKTKEIPVVIFTNLDERTKGYPELAKQMGALDYWVKAHYQPNQVVDRVHRLLEQNARG